MFYAQSLIEDTVCPPFRCRLLCIQPTFLSLKSRLQRRIGISEVQLTVLYKPTWTTEFTLTKTSHPLPPPVSIGRFTGLDTLEVAQSITFPIALYDNICAAIQYRQHRTPKRFTRRSDGTTIRVWRTV